MKTIGEMKHFHGGRILLFNVFILLAQSINVAHSETVPNKDNLLFINITMKNFETTQVNQSNHYRFFSQRDFSFQEDQYSFVQYKLPDEELTISKS